MTHIHIILACSDVNIQMKTFGLKKSVSQLGLYVGCRTRQQWIVWWGYYNYKIINHVTLSEPACIVYLQRAAGDHDEEALKLTRGILSNNPDELTLWNYRKDVFLKLKESR